MTVRISVRSFAYLSNKVDAADNGEIQALLPISEIINSKLELYPRIVCYGLTNFEKIVDPRFPNDFIIYSDLLRNLVIISKLQERVGSTTNAPSILRSLVYKL